MLREEHRPGALKRAIVSSEQERSARFAGGVQNGLPRCAQQPESGDTKLLEAVLG
jgi:hypothetical protein